MRHLFLVNPAAGKNNTTQDFVTHIRAVCHRLDLKEGRDFDIQISQAPGDITRWAGEAAGVGDPLRVYACGGDGTLNEAVCGVAPHANAAVTHVPRGTGNDFIRMFTKTAPFRDLEALVTTSREVTCDLIAFGEDVALNYCSLGLDARIGTEVGRYKHLPLLSGHGAYLLSTAVNLVKGIAHHYRIEVEGQVIDGEQTIIYIGNGRWYGGGFQPVPESDPTDGQLDVLLIHKLSRFTIAKFLGEYEAGRYASYPQLCRHIRTDRVMIFCDQEEPITLDGEKRMGQQVEVTLSPYKLRFFYPENVEFIRQSKPR